MEGNYFRRAEQAAERDLRGRVVGAGEHGPVSAALAALLGLQTVKRASRKLRRQGWTFLHQPASTPTRHTVCKHCDRRTWTNISRTCRRCFLAGEGDDLDWDPFLAHKPLDGFTPILNAQPGDVLNVNGIDMQLGDDGLFHTPRAGERR